jgi:hypothetical protein
MGDVEFLFTTVGNEVDWQLSVELQVIIIEQTDYRSNFMFVEFP